VLKKYVTPILILRFITMKITNPLQQKRMKWSYFMVICNLTVKGRIGFDTANTKARYLICSHPQTQFHHFNIIMRPLYQVANKISLSFMSRSSGPWCGVVLWYEATWTSETMVSYHNTTRRHNPEDLDLKHHHREGLKTPILCSVFFYHIALYFNFLP
jgi:hypothetical protein